MDVIIRFKFYRDERLRFLSHLDMQRLFQRAFRRGNIPTAYSNGFNPHIRLSFAGALPLGMITDEEYGDIVLNQDMKPADFSDIMNQVLPAGMGISEAYCIDPKTPSLASSVRRADYVVTLFDQWDAPDDAIITDASARFMTADEIIIQKRNKKKQIVDTDIRPYIGGLTYGGREEHHLTFHLSILYREQKCVKALQVFRALSDFGKLNLKVDESLKLHKIRMMI